MNLNKKFAIYSGEKYSKADNGKSHSYLVLVDETPDETGKRRILERIHFDGVPYHAPEDGSFKFVMGDKTREEKNKYLEDYEGDLFGIVGGDEEHMNDMWGYAKHVAKKVDSLKTRFYFDDVAEQDNCRSGVIVVLKKMGVDFTILNKTKIGLAGTQSNLHQHPEIVEIPTFDKHNDIPKYDTLAPAA